MNCPACRTEMELLDILSVELDQCPSCRGVWLDHHEIDALFSMSKIPGRLTDPEIYKAPATQIPEGHRTCPRCNVFLTLVPLEGISLDVCARCKGFFTDLGELKTLAEAAERRFREEA